jgi:hypothetical protein
MKRAIRITINILISPILVFLYAMFWLSNLVDRANLWLHDASEFSKEINKSLNDEILRSVFKDFFK